MSSEATIHCRWRLLCHFNVSNSTIETYTHKHRTPDTRLTRMHPLRTPCLAALNRTLSVSKYLVSGSITYFRSCSPEHFHVKKTWYIAPSHTHKHTHGHAISTIGRQTHTDTYIFLQSPHSHAEAYGGKTSAERLQGIQFETLISSLAFCILTHRWFSQLALTPPATLYRVYFC